MSIVTVNSSAGLLSALKLAHGGDTILLAGGTYSPILIQNYHPNGSINIASASVSNQAVITALTVSLSSGLKFSNLTFATALTNAPTSTQAPTPFVVGSSSNISFDRINVHGTMDNNPQDDVNGMRIQGSSNVTITNSTFQQLYNAITDLNNTNINISNNVFHDLRNDGIDNGGTSNVVISNNSFTDFHPVGAVGSTGDHADAIQFWTTNTTSDASNIVISNNSYLRGDGAAVQGIFVTDQVGLHFDNVTITGNSVIGSEYNAIEVYSANNLNLSSNTVESYSDMASYIAVKSVNNVTMNNNIATSYMLTSNIIISQLANQTIGAVSAIASASSQAITAVAEAASVAERQTISGNALVGDQGNGLYLADVGVGAAGQKAVAGSGSTFTGTYGTLTVQTNGSYSYSATKESLTVGQSYDDHFTITVANGHGGVQSSTLDFIVGGSGLGTAGVNNIIGGAGAETITGLGGADNLVSGGGPDTFAYTSVADSTPTAFDTIRGFKSGDVLDLSGVDPHFRIVTAFDHHADELIVKNDGNGAWDIFGDTTGSGVANFQIHLAGATTALNSTDIHL